MLSEQLKRNGLGAKTHAHTSNSTDAILGSGIVLLTEVSGYSCAQESRYLLYTSNYMVTFMISLPTNFIRYQLNCKIKIPSDAKN